MISRNEFRRLSLSQLILSITLFSSLQCSQTSKFDDDFIDVGIRLNGDSSDYLIADLIATENNFDNGGYIKGIDMYHFRINLANHRRSKRSVDELIDKLKQDNRIDTVMVGERLKRGKREISKSNTFKNSARIRKTDFQSSGVKNLVETKKILKMNFNDSLYSKQWYLENIGQLDTPIDHDINVVPVWQAGFTGRNITICIIDDGVEHKHPELIEKYKPEFSYDLNDLNDKNHDPTPVMSDDDNSHGTRCASAATGSANNGFCGVGVAYNANIAGIRLLDGIVTSLLEARALSMFVNDIDIKSASWGPLDDGKSMEAPTHLIEAALDYAVTHGRHGKGTILVWASGNGGLEGDDCGADGYASHHNVISIGTINHEGKTTYFSERCSSTMAVAYTGGQHRPSKSETPMPIGVITADLDGKCTTSFFGTSAAAPLAAGSFALVLEANPALTYRDIMHIVAETARIPNLSETDGWFINGAGYHVNNKFGFGVLDVAQMVSLAQNWDLVQPRYDCYHEYEGDDRIFSMGKPAEIEFDIGHCGNITRLEHVIANISYSYYRRGDVKIVLISPSGTPSDMLSFRENDKSERGIKYFPFMSVHHWGEPPIGQWRLRVESRKRYTYPSEETSSEAFHGRIDHFGLRFYGSYRLNDLEKHRSKKESFISPGFYAKKNEIETLYRKELKIKTNPNIETKH